MNKKQAADFIRYARDDWGDYLVRSPCVKDMTGALAVVVESATHDEVVLVFDGELSNYMVYDPETLDVLIKKLKKASRRILNRA